MALPQAVIEAANYIDQDDEKYVFETYCYLTKPDFPQYLEYCEKMWRSLEKRSDEKDEIYWVLWFVKKVSEARHLPPYYYHNKKQHQKVAEQLKTAIKTLVKLSIENELDYHFLYHRDGVLGGYYFYESLCEQERMWVNDMGNPTIAMSKILQKYKDLVLDDLNQVPAKGNAGENVHIKRFIRYLART